MKQTDSDINRRKLTDKLASPPQFGPLIGLLATTFEMQPEFFETDFLPAVLNLGAWDDRSWTSRIEIEKKLAHMESATMFLDASRYRNRPRSLRVRIVPVSLGGGRSLHSKVVLLVFENAVRLIVGSANLTQPGYRENREVAAVLTASEKRRQDTPLISDALSGLPDVMGTWWTGECESLMKKAMDRLEGWGFPGQEKNEWFFWGGGGQPLWRAFVSRWPEPEQVERITIVSPFWYEDDKHRAFTTLVDALRERGSPVVSEAQVRLLTEASPDTATTYKPTLPSSFGVFDFRSLGARVSAQAVDPIVLKEEVGMEGFSRLRHLHAKVVLFEGGETSMAYLGSANFTRRGWGFLDAPTKANVEAGIIIRRTKKARHAIEGLVPGTTGPIVELKGDSTTRIAAPEPDPEPLTWPQFVKEVLLVPSSENPDLLDLEITVTPDAIEGEWSLCVALKDSDVSEEVIFDSVTNPKDKGVHKTSLEEGHLNALLREQEVIVHWWGHDEGQVFPINVSQEARHALPVSPGRHKLSEQHLILYYQGRITWEELFPDEAGKGKKGDEPPGLDDGYDRGVDTSMIQSYQVREFVEALKGIVDDLRCAARATEPAMRLALLGPVSPVSLARAVMDAVASKEKSPIAAGFQLVEIQACLDQTRSFQTDEKYRDAWVGYIDEATEVLSRYLDRLREEYSGLFRTQSLFARYEQSIRTYYTRESKGL